jgi:hypothetical protein
VTSNILRSSFVVELLGSEDASLSLRTSAAAMMRHSLEEQVRTYDRRAPETKKKLAMQWLAKRASPTEAIEQQPERPVKVENMLFAKDDLVVVRNTQEKSFRFARVLSCNGESCKLMELCPVASGGYRASLQSVYNERCSSIFHCDAFYDESAKVYRLRSTVEDILGLF